MVITQRPKGTKDWYADAILQRREIERTLRILCDDYRIQEIETPIFEHSILFQRGVGETTDVVQKEMYTFFDKANRSITLKPEGTASVMRAYLENHLDTTSGLTKLFYFTPAFRYEQPQAGRLRQHHQFGIEYIGTKEALAEVELILFIERFLRTIGLQGFQLHLNSIGERECRERYNTALRAYLKEKEEKLCSLCRQRLEKNPMRVLDCKNEQCQAVLQDAPRTIDFLEEESKQHLDQVQKYLDCFDIPYKIDTQLVRGLDYYTRTVFEWKDAQGLTLCGGGRYDYLLKEIGEKQDIPSVGFGMGIERLLFFLEKQHKTLPVQEQACVYVGPVGQENQLEVYRLVWQLRESGISVETDYLNRSVKAQMKYANKIQATYTILIGTEELERKILKVKQMKTHEEVEVSWDNLVSYLKQEVQ